MDKNELIRRWREAEDAFDDFLAAILRSAWTLAAFVAWTLLAVVFGFWVAR